MLRSDSTLVGLEAAVDRAVAVAQALRKQADDAAALADELGGIIAVVASEKKADRAAIKPALISRRDAAAMLGVSTKTLQRLTERDEIASVHIDSRVLYSPRSLRLFARARELVAAPTG